MVAYRRALAKSFLHKLRVHTLVELECDTHRELMPPPAAQAQAPPPPPPPPAQASTTAALGPLGEASLAVPPPAVPRSWPLLRPGPPPLPQLPPGGGAASRPAPLGLKYGPGLLLPSPPRPHQPQHHLPTLALETASTSSSPAAAPPLASFADLQGPPGGFGGLAGGPAKVKQPRALRPFLAEAAVRDGGGGLDPRERSAGASYDQVRGR